MALDCLANFINGKYCNPISNQYFESYNPSTENVIHMIPDSGPDDVEMAVEVAKIALPKWSSTSREHRSGLLLKLADLLEGNLRKFGTKLNIKVLS